MSAITDSGVVLTDSRVVDAHAVVVATEGPTAARLLGLADPGSRSVAAVHLAADTAPVPDRTIILDGDRRGPATNVAVMSNVAPSYAPPGRALIVVEIPAPPRGPDTELLDAVRRQLREWWGSTVDGWQHLSTIRIAHAHPDQRAGSSLKRRGPRSAAVSTCAEITATPRRYRARSTPAAAPRTPSSPTFAPALPEGVGPAESATPRPPEHSSHGSAESVHLPGKPRNTDKLTHETGCNPESSERVVGGR